MHNNNLKKYNNLRYNYKYCNIIFSFITFFTHVFFSPFMFTGYISFAESEYLHNPLPAGFGCQQISFLYKQKIFPEFTPHNFCYNS